ncbi:MAG: hypothetical protein ACTSQF_07320 [Candidatus Heimdallarchaeaceae archaeon]
MDNEPKYLGDHERWSYHRIKKDLVVCKYRMPSIAQKMREKRKEEKKEED